MSEGYHTPVAFNTYPRKAPFAAIAAGHELPVDQRSVLVSATSDAMGRAAMTSHQ
jgi:hypothetical protein